MHVTATPIPWEHVGTTGMAAWRWITANFILTITSAGTVDRAQYQWTIEENSDPTAPWTIQDGIAHTFFDAQSAAVEFAIKSYPNGGYRAYGPQLASTYTLWGGRRADLSAFHGVTVRMECRGANGDTVHIGRLLTGRHELVLINESGEWLVRSESVRLIEETVKGASARRGGVS